MNLHQACTNMLDQLCCFLDQIKQQDYCNPADRLNQSSPGQHVRHMLEFFLCLKQGLETGIVNYDKRSHDKLVEQDKAIARNVLDLIKKFISSSKTDKPLKLEVSYSHSEGIYTTLDTNYYRELAYNIEHAVHHMAIIKIGVRELNYISLPAGFGIAASTIRFKETAAGE